MINKSEMEESVNLKGEKSVFLYLTEPCSYDAKNFVFLLFDFFLFCKPVCSTKSDSACTKKISGGKGYDTPA